MARLAVLGNGSLTVGLDENGLVNDFYFPYVGLENLNNARMNPHFIGVCVDGVFSWLHDKNWKNTVILKDDAMVSLSSHVNETLRMTINIESFVDCHDNAFIRKVMVHNDAHEQIEFRIFFHQAFQISSEGRSDTALYVPDEHYILDYKGRCSLLIKAAFDDGDSFDQYAAGNYGIEGKEGTYKDAEDGNLSMNAVEHAGVDSTIRLSTKIGAGESKSLHYWIVASDSDYNARKVNKSLLANGIQQRLLAQHDHWRMWLEPAQDQLSKMQPEHRRAVNNSLFVIKAHVDKHGGIIASCDSSIYNYSRDYYSYVWPRDGAFAIWPLIKLGIYAEAKKFFEFCRDTISPDGYMMHKYQADKAIGSTWHPLLHRNHSELAIQEDETALVIFMLGEYFEHSKDIEFIRSNYESLIRPMANFMASFIDNQTGLPHASYDLWEQKFLSSTFSTGATYKALKVAARFAKAFGKIEDHDFWLSTATKIRENADMYFDPERQAFRKGFLLKEDGEIEFDNTLDISSLYSAFIFKFATSNKQILSTAMLIESELLDISPSGGAPRYENDNYLQSQNPYKGNPWSVTTLWMAQFYNAIGDTDKTRHYIDWVLKHSTSSGVFSEQVNPEDGSIVGVAPLVWSHAELINTILDLG